MPSNSSTLLRSVLFQYSFSHPVLCTVRIALHLCAAAAAATAATCYRIAILGTFLLGRSFGALLSIELVAASFCNSEPVCSKA